MEETIIFDIVELILWEIVIGVLFLCAIIYFYKGYKRENFEEKIFMLGFTWFFLSFAIMRIFFILRDFHSQETPPYEVFTKCAYISGIIGFSLFFLMFEISVKRTKYLITAINTVFIVSMVIMPLNLVRSLIYILAIINGLLIFILLFMLSIRYRDRFQGGLPFIWIGYIIIIAGYALYWAKNIFTSPIIISPILHILGSFIIISPIIIKFRKSSRLAFLCMIFITIALIIIYALLSLDISIEESYYTEVIPNITMRDWYQYNFIPWVITIIILITYGIILLSRSHRITKDFIMQRQFYSAYGFSLLSFGISRAFFLPMEVEILAKGKTVFSFILGSFGWIFVYLGFYFLIRYFDKVIINSYKYILSKLTIGYAIFTLFITIFNPFLIQIIDIVILNFFMIFILIGIYILAMILLFVYLRILVVIKVRSFYRILLFSIGFILIIFVYFIDQIFLITINYYEYPYLMLIPPFQTIIGLILFGFNINYGFKVFLEFYSTKQICLVHRGRIEGITHLCPQCFVKYCDNCFHSVITVENKCWSCNYNFIIKYKSIQQVVSDEKIIEIEEPYETNEEDLKNFKKGVKNKKIKIEKKK